MLLSSAITTPNGVMCQFISAKQHWWKGWFSDELVDENNT